MLCEHCKQNNATIYLNETVNGKSRSLSLCADCAAKLRENGELPAMKWFTSPGWDFPAWDEDVASLTDAMFGGLFGGPFGLSPAAHSNQLGYTRKTCPVCGSSPEDFRRTGRVGCSACYSTFANELDRVIRSIHGDARHVGRAPAEQSESRDRAHKLEHLKDELDEAVRKEDFEEAIRLRDEIRKLESNAGDGGSDAGTEGKE